MSSSISSGGHPGSRSTPSSTTSAPLHPTPYPSKRPGHGRRGREIQLVTNLFLLNLPRNFVVYKYRVELSLLKGKPPRQRKEEIKSREERRAAFWYVVNKYHDIFKHESNIIYDDFETSWVCDPIRPPNNRKEFETRERVVLDATRSEKPSDISFFIYPLNEQSVDLKMRDEMESAQFLKTLFLQQMRFPTIPLHDEQMERHVKDCRESFITHRGSVYRIPRTPSYPKVEVCAGVEAWIGLYANFRLIEDYHPVVNFGLVNQLFVKMEMDLITFWVDVLHEVYLLSNLTKEEKHNCTMDKSKRQIFSQRLKKLRLKTTWGIAMENDPPGPPCRVLRHYRLEGLADPRMMRVEECYTAPPPRGGGRGGRGRGRGRGGHGGTRPDTPRSKFEICWDRFGATAATMILSGGRSMEQVYGDMGRVIEYPHMPLCVVQTGGKVNFLPMEVLLTHDTPEVYKEILDFETKMKYIRGVSRHAKKHLSITNSFVQKLSIPSDPFIKEFGRGEIKVSAENLECTGRVLQPPKVASEDGELDPHEIHRGFSLTRFQKRPPIDEAEFVVVNANENELPMDQLMTFYYALIKICEERGLRCVKQPFERLPWDPENRPMVEREPFHQVATYIKGRFVKEYYREGENCLYRLCVIVCTPNSFDVYGEVKSALNSLGIANQVIRTETIKKAITDQRQICYNLSMKIHAKLGGITHELSASGIPDDPNIPHGVPLAQSGLTFMIKDQPTMFIGIDVTHPTANSGIKGISIASMVASVNMNASKYKTRVLAQMAAKETIFNFDSCQLEELIAAFIEETHQTPSHLVFLRDGVSDGQFMTVTSTELEWFKASWNKVTNGQPVTFTYIIIQKRHHVRLYPKNPEDAAGPAHNIPSGTSVDKTIVRPDVYDFYLASQHGQIGTTRPARYIVMYDEWGLGVDQLQEMMYYLCFLYSRCCHPVSIPAPLYYAHLVCEQAKEVYKWNVRSQRLEEREGPRENASLEFNEKWDIEEVLNPHRLYPGMPWM